MSGPGWGGDAAKLKELPQETPFSTSHHAPRHGFPSNSGHHTPRGICEESCRALGRRHSHGKAFAEGNRNAGFARLMIH